MSAIFGIIDFEQRPINKEWILSMQKDLAHRGPDKQEVYQEKSMFFGHMLLQVTPESVYDTSPYKEDGFVITAYARLDEREAIMNRLQIPVAERKSITDPLLLLRSYLKFGKNFVKDIYGDFAFAIWDTNKKELFCARDQMGVKPFYYYFKDNRFIFSTEIKSIVQLNIVEKTINNIYLRDRALGVDSDIENTTWLNIKLLTQANTLSFYNDALSLQKYWFPKYNKNNKYQTEEDSTAELLRILKQTITDHTRTIGNVGADLSGGLDSSTLVCLASEELLKENKNITTVSSLYESGYSNTNNPDEKEYVDEVIKNIKNISPYFVDRSNFNFWKGLKEQYKKSFTPVFFFYYVQNAMLNVYHKKGIRRVLSGHPGDFTVSNSAINPYAILLCTGRFKRFINLVKLSWNKKHQSLLQFIKINILIEIIPWSLQKIYLKLRNIEFYDDSDTSHFPYDFEYKEKKKIEKELFKLNRYASYKESHIVDHIWSQKISIIDEELDCIAAQHNVEITYPFADRRLIEFLLEIPVEHFYTKGIHRGLIRAALKGILPDKITQRKDKGDFSPGHISIFKKEIPQICEFIDKTKFDFSMKSFIDKKKLLILLYKIKKLDKDQIFTYKTWSLFDLAQIYLFNKELSKKQ